MTIQEIIAMRIMIEIGPTHTGCDTMKLHHLRPGKALMNILPRTKVVIPDKNHQRNPSAAWIKTITTDTVQENLSPRIHRIFVTHPDHRISNEVALGNCLHPREEVAKNLPQLTSRNHKTTIETVTQRRRIGDLAVIGMGLRSSLCQHRQSVTIALLDKKEEYKVILLS